MPITKSQFGDVQGGVNQLYAAQAAQEKAKLEAYLKGQQQQQDLATVQGLRKQLGEDVPVHVGDVAIGGKDKLMTYLRAQQLKEIQDERERRRIQDIEHNVEKVGTAQALPAMQRVEEAIPGVFTNEAATPQLKSMGGLRTLVPNLAVPALESVGWMPEGAGKERMALQEMANVKIYDSSGKQINEAEMKRIQDAMGMRGIFKPEDIIRTLRQAGATVLEKQKQVSAGAEPKALQEFKGRGGLAGYSTLPELLGTQKSSVPSASQVPQPAQTQRIPVKKLFSPSRNQTKIQYSDGSEEVVDGKQ